MRKLIQMKTGWAVTLYLFLVLLATGAGMGVPFFNILLGLPVGWWLVYRLSSHTADPYKLMGKLLLWSAITAAASMLAMAIIWLPTFLMLFDPAADLANFGIPMILFEPRASFIGWLGLMVVFSPFLQMLFSLFSAQVTLWLSKNAFRHITNPATAETVNG
jgi:hypothetical protein